MALNLDSVVQYIPEFRGERSRYEKGENKAPLTFHIRVMGAVPFRSFAAKLAKASGPAGQSEMNAEVLALYQQVLSEQVMRIENLVVDGQAIAQGEAFAQHPAMPHELVMEIERAIVDVNRVSEQDEKN